MADRTRDLEHAWRIGRTCGLLAAGLGLDRREVELIRLEPAKLSDSEVDVIKTHTTIGASILSGSNSTLLGLAERNALAHHERWDGQGYPAGLAGQEIPVAARIAAVAVPLRSTKLTFAPYSGVNVRLVG